MEDWHDRAFTRSPSNPMSRGQAFPWKKLRNEVKESIPSSGFAKERAGDRDSPRGKMDQESRSVTRRRFHINSATVGLDQGFGNREAQPRFPRLLGA